MYKRPGIFTPFRRDVARISGLYQQGTIKSARLTTMIVPVCPWK